MTRNEATLLVMQRLGKRTGLDADVVAELKQAQNDLELGVTLPWFLKKSLSGLVTVAGTRTVALPTDFLRETDERWREVATSGTASLTKGSYDELYEREIFGAGYLASQYYAIVGTNMYLFPTPAEVKTISGFYYAKDAVLSADGTENNWLLWLPGLLIARAGIRMAKTLRDNEAYGMFKEDYIEAYNGFLSTETAREQAALTTIAGG